MIWIDVAILAVIALSAIIGFFRGFLREALGLATWIVAFWIAFMFATPVSDYLRRWIDADSARLAASFALVFIGVLVVGAVLNYLIGRLVSQTGFAGTDRALGIVFGVVRGVAVLILLVLLAGVTPVPKDPWWQQSLFVGQLEAGAIQVRDYLPPNIAQAINYPGTPVDARAASDHATT